MFFNNKIDTDIDSEFEKKKFNLKLPNISGKNLLLLVVGVLLLIFGIVFFVMFNKDNKINYFLEVNGEDLITIYKGNKYEEPGYTGWDNKGNDLTSMVTVDSNVDIDTIGDYEIIYTLYDKTFKRYVTVTDKPVGATYIYLKGDSTIYLNLNEEYEEPGYLVVDSIDSNLTDRVKTYQNINTKKKGTYKIVYMVTNSTGVTTSAKRTVIVMDGNISLSLDNEEYTNEEVLINVYIIDNYFEHLELPDGSIIYDKVYTYKVSENGEYKFVSYNKTGKETEAKITVSNIDREGPTGSCSGSYGDGKSNVVISAQDKAGISKYMINGSSYSSNNITISNEYDTVTVTVYDKLGNSNDVTCNLSKRNTLSPSSSSSKPSNITDIDTSHYTYNNGIRNQKVAEVDATDLGCTVVDGKFNTVSSIVVNQAISDNFHGILTNVCSYVNTVSWMDYLQHDGAFAARPIIPKDYHSRGLAIDLNDLWVFNYGNKSYRPYAGQGNSTWNRYTQFICDVCNGKEDCEYNINYIIYKRYFSGNGWCWGGNWSPGDFDPMHFELREGNCLTKNKAQIRCN